MGLDGFPRDFFAAVEGGDIDELAARLREDEGAARLILTLSGVQAPVSSGEGSAIPLKPIMVFSGTSKRPYAHGGVTHVVETPAGDIVLRQLPPPAQPVEFDA